MSSVKVTSLIHVRDSSEVGEARRSVALIAREHGFGESETGQISIIATELANNLANHAQSGMLLVRILERSGSFGIEILSVDGGPGIANIGECLRDGFSTKGTPGNGMGAIQRLSHFFDIYSTPGRGPGKGTVVLSQFWSRAYMEKSRPAPTNELFELGVISVPDRGEKLCGDSWGMFYAGPDGVIVVADGLGHGALAAEASNLAVKTVSQNLDKSPLTMIEYAHGALRITRGAAVSLLRFDADRKSLTFAGVGNIASLIYKRDLSVRRMVSHNGTVGLVLRKPKDFRYDWDESSTLIMHSDGISTHWKLDDYPGVLAKHPSVIAGVLFRDFKRATDDATILVAQERKGTALR